jgi:arabinose-5-phosphate isomerase
LLRVDELMTSGDAVPRVSLTVPLRDAIVEMTSRRLGCTCVTDATGALAGIITDGDLRRLLQKTSDVSGIAASDAMTRNPKTVRLGTLAVNVLQEMEAYNITQMIVVDDTNAPAGVIHLHDLVKAGLGGDDTP